MDYDSQIELEAHSLFQFDLMATEYKFICTPIVNRAQTMSICVPHICIYAILQTESQVHNKQSFTVRKRGVIIAIPGTLSTIHFGQSTKQHPASPINDLQIAATREGVCQSFVFSR